jgi:N-formylglutamate deformylase
VSDVYRFSPGAVPLLISVPHDGRDIPPEISARMTDEGRQIPDTDWHVEKLYDFASTLGASVIVANYSRYVVDLNRAAEDVNLYPGQIATGLCPEQTFDGEAIYQSGSVGDDEKAARTKTYWRPYHDKIRTTLTTMREQHGYALLWDAHSIPSLVPRLFAGELPVLNLGSNKSASCSANIEAAVANTLSQCPFSNVVNGRFKGGHITRNFGDPDNRIHALQLEIAQRAYMIEETGVYDGDKAAKLRTTLMELLKTYLDVGNR